MHNNKEYRVLLTPQGFGAVEDMSWGDAQERTSPDLWRFIGPHGGIEETYRRSPGGAAI